MLQNDKIEQLICIKLKLSKSNLLAPCFLGYFNPLAFSTLKSAPVNICSQNLIVCVTSCFICNSVIVYYGRVYT